MNKLLKFILIIYFFNLFTNNKEMFFNNFINNTKNFFVSTTTKAKNFVVDNSKKLVNESKKIAKSTFCPRKVIVKTEYRGNMKINTYTLGLDKYKELTCLNGTKLMPNETFSHALSKVNGCGSEKWSQFPRDVLNTFAAKGGYCCNNHDLCYYGYKNNGEPYISNNTFNSKNCESDFKACDPMGIMAPSVMLMSPSFLEESKFKCVY